MTSSNDFTEQVRITASQIQMAADATMQIDDLGLQDCGDTRAALQGHIAALVRSLVVLLEKHERRPP